MQSKTRWFGKSREHRYNRNKNRNWIRFTHWTEYALPT